MLLFKKGTKWKACGASAATLVLAEAAVNVSKNVYLSVCSNVCVSLAASISPGFGHSILSSVLWVGYLPYRLPSLQATPLQG